ncbi:cytochrome 71A4 [Capsicum chacoense]
MIFLPLSLLASLISILFIAILLKCFSKSQNILPPSPWKLPVIGNLHQLGKHPHRSLQMLSKKYGPLMLLQLGKNPALIVSSADAAHDILKTHDLVFSNRAKTSVHDRLLYGSKDMAFASYGEYWRQVRSICVIQLLSNTRVQSFNGVREEETLLMVKKIRELCSVSRHLGMNLSDILREFTSDVFCRIALGRKYADGETGNKFKFLLNETVELLGEFNVGSYIPWLRWVDRLNGLDKRVEIVAKEFDKFLQRVVDEHRDDKSKNSTEVGPTDFVDILLELQRQGKAGFSIQIDTVKAVILDIFAGGTDTTYTIFEWAMTELLRHPTAMNKLQNEAREIAKAKSEIVSEDELDKMHYLKAVIKETLRLHPPIPLLVPRQARQHVKVMGYDVGAGTMVITNGWAIGRDPEIWEDAEEFKPERFLNSDIDFKGQDFRLIPFGSGRRGCPGISFAMATNELVLANVVRNFDWQLPNGAKGADLDMTECTGLTIHRKVPHLLLQLQTISSLFIFGLQLIARLNGCNLMYFVLCCWFKCNLCFDCCLDLLYRS